MQTKTDHRNLVPFACETVSGKHIVVQATCVMHAKAKIQEDYNEIPQSIKKL